MHTYTETGNVLRMRYACVTHRGSVCVFKSREERDNTRVNSLRQPYGLLQPLFPPSAILSTHHLGFPILGRTSIDVRFAVVTVKSRGLSVVNDILECEKAKRSEDREKTFSCQRCDYYSLICANIIYYNNTYYIFFI